MVQIPSFNDHFFMLQSHPVFHLLLCSFKLNFGHNGGGPLKVSRCRRSLERQACMCALVNPWWCWNVLCGFIGQCFTALGARQRGAVFVTSALLSSSLVTFQVSLFNTFFHHQAQSLTVYSQLFGSISHALRSRLYASLNRRAGLSTLLTPVPNCSNSIEYSTSLVLRLSPIQLTSLSSLVSWL